MMTACPYIRRFVHRLRLTAVMRAPRGRRNTPKSASFARAQAGQIHLCAGGGGSEVPGVLRNMKSTAPTVCFKASCLCAPKCVSTKVAARWRQRRSSAKFIAKRVITRGYGSRCVGAGLTAYRERLQLEQGGAAASRAVDRKENGRCKLSGRRPHRSWGVVLASFLSLAPGARSAERAVDPQASVQSERACCSSSTEIRIIDQPNCARCPSQPDGRIGSLPQVDTALDRRARDPRHRSALLTGALPIVGRMRISAGARASDLAFHQFRTVWRIG